MELSELLTPSAVAAKFAEAGIRISERELRRRARELTACREIGKALVFTLDDIEKIIEGAVPGHPAPGDGAR